MDWGLIFDIYAILVLFLPEVLTMYLNINYTIWLMVLEDNLKPKN